MIHDSEARLHYLSIRTNPKPSQRPLGYDVKVVYREDLYKQPYALPSHWVEE